jgi:hypothetical protein
MSWKNRYHVKGILLGYFQNMQQRRQGGFTVEEDEEEEGSA